VKWNDTTKIDAPAALVWRLTTEVEDWPSLTPTMTSVKLLDPGPLRVGSRARIKQPGQGSATWTVSQLEPDRSFRWATTRPGLTRTGTHQISSDGAGSHNALHLEATGFLARPFGLLFGPAIRRSLRVENAGFKGRAEQLAVAASPPPPEGERT
jgi:uncharacterized membrane protein